MTPFARLLRRLLEKTAGTFYEGPTPPARLGEMAIAFANAHPGATRSEWIAYAQHLARESYQSGFVRGAEWAERDFQSRMPDVKPEEVADLEDPNWRWYPAITMQGDDTVAREQNEDEES